MSYGLSGAYEKLLDFNQLLRNTNFRRLFAGRMVSTVGDNLYLVASMWLIFELTGSTYYTGLAGFLSRIPGMLQFLAGPVVDRRDVRWVLAGTEFVQLLFILTVPVAAAFGALNVWLLLAIVPILSLTNQFSRPAQKAALPKVVADSQMVRANSMFSLSYRAVQSGSKAVAGWLIAAMGAVVVFVIDAATFVLGGLLFLSVGLPEAATARVETDDDEEDRLSNFVADIKEGLSIITGSVLLYAILGGAFANFFSSVSLAVLPEYASTISGAITYGLMYGGTGAGLFVGALAASFFEDYSFGRVTAAIFTFTGVTWTAAILVQSPELTVVLFAVAWIPVGIYNVIYTSVVQLGVPDDVIGRVWATSNTVSGVLSPLGFLIGGALGELWASTDVMLLTGVGFVLIGGFWLAVPQLRSFPPVTSFEERTFDGE